MTLQNFYQDADATETQEWLEAFAAIVEREGAERAKFILQVLNAHAHRYGVQLSRLNTPYLNTISPHEESDVGRRPLYGASHSLVNSLECLGDGDARQ
jgi:pyruvate dehydrogenase E1 component